MPTEHLFKKKYNRTVNFEKKTAKRKAAQRTENCLNNYMNCFKCHDISVFSFHAFAAKGGQNCVPLPSNKLSQVQVETGSALKHRGGIAWLQPLNERIEK